jgi:two-component system chemotaxis sensor kinase CheA
VLLVRGNPIAVAVNELIGQLEVVQKPLEGLLMNHPLISGTALLGNGQIIMIIDPISVLDLGENIKDKSIALEVADAI